MNRETLYLNFVSQRHVAWRYRMGLSPEPPTDPIILGHKFTNVFRVLDYGTQFLIRELLYREPNLTLEDALFRCTLYRYTNRPEPWLAFRAQVGRYPRAEDASGLLGDVWGRYRDDGGKIFGTAYRMFVGAENVGVSRLDWSLRLARDVFANSHALVDSFASAGSIPARINALQQNVVRCGRFMSMQIVTDMGYSSLLKGDENEYVVPGPGCVAGAKVLGWTAEEAVIHGYENAPDDVYLWIARGVKRRPSLMDIQNTLCEFSKYARYLDKGQTARTYRPTHAQLSEPFYPPHWYK